MNTRKRLPSSLNLFKLHKWKIIIVIDPFLLQMRIMDNKLFNIEPSRGKLRPGQSQTITFTYNHDFAGTDRLPVLFKLTRGREILVSNFICHSDVQ